MGSVGLGGSNQSISRPQQGPEISVIQGIGFLPYRQLDPEELLQYLEGIELLAQEPGVLLFTGKEKVYPLVEPDVSVSVLQVKALLEMGKRLRISSAV